MSGFEQWLNSLTGIVAMPMWLAGAVAALAVFGSLLAFGRVTPAGRIGLAWRIALVLVGVGLLWVLVESQGGREQAAWRRSLDARAAELTLRAIMPGSPLACLDAVASPAVEDGCEKALFGSPEMVAAAVAYVDARLAILADGLELAARDRIYAASIERQRRALENDRFGLVAHVFASRGCTVNDCDALKLLRQAHRVIANLHERQFDANVVLYATAWKHDGLGPHPPSAVAAASAPAAGPAVAAAPNAMTTGSAPAIPKIDYPSAASIPAISIMNAEPPLPPGETAAMPPLPNAAPVAKPPVQPRRETARETSPPLPPAPQRQAPQPPPQQVQQQAPQPAPAPAAPPAPSIPRWGGG